jgi:hypothetical protein
MFAKVFTQIYDSSIAENPELRFTFMDLLVLADINGVVDMTHEAIARRTNRPIEIVRRTIAELEQPDPKSRSKEDGGRRLRRLDDHRDWGWLITNYDHFRKIASDEQRREKTSARVAKYRQKDQQNEECNAPVTPCNALSRDVTPVTLGRGRGRGKGISRGKKEEETAAPASAGDGDCPPPDGQITYLNTGKKGKKPKALKKPREPDPYFDGLANLFRIDPAGTGGGRIARLKKLFIEHGADLAEVERRAEAYRTSKKFEGCMLTGEAVEKHWGELDDPDGMWEGDSFEQIERANQPVYGFDWFADLRHETAFKAAAAKRGMTLQEYLNWRAAWSEKNGAYTPERPAPPEDETA